MRGVATAIAILLICGVAPAAPDQKLTDEIARLDKEYADAWGKQALKLAQQIAQKLYDLQVKATGAGSEEAERRLLILGAMQMGTGDYVSSEKTELAYLKAMEKRHGAESQKVLEALESLLSIYAVTGRYEDMEPLHKRALAIAKKLNGEKSAEYAYQLDRYGGFLGMRNMYTPAQQIAEEALQVHEALAKDKGEDSLVLPIRAVGWAYWQNNQTKKAIAAYDRAIKIAIASKTMAFTSKVTTIWQTGQTYQNGGRADLATPLFDKAIAMADAEVSRLEKAKAKTEEIQSVLGELGTMYQIKRDYAKAEATFARALKLGAANVQMSLADAKRMQGKNKEALELIEKEQARLAKIAPTAVENYNYFVAEIAKEMGNSKRAMTAIDSYLKLQERQWGKKHTVYGNAAYAAVSIYARAGKVTDAERFLGEYLDVGERELGKVLRAGSESDQTVYFQRNAYVLDNAINFQINFAPKSAPAVRLALTTLLRRKGRLLDAAAATLATIRTKLSPADQKFLDELASVRAQLAKLSVSSQGLSKEDLAKQVAALEEKIQKLEGEIAKKSSAYAAVTQQIELAPIQKKLPADARLIEFVNYQPMDPKITYAQLLERKFKPRRYGAYVLGPKGDPAFVELGEAAPIDVAVEKLRKALADPDNDGAIDLGKALYDLTLAKIAPKLGSATNILLAPDGALNVVPFAALADDKKELLIKKFTFTYLTSGRDLLRVYAKTKSAGGGVIFADPSFDKSTPAGKGSSSRGRRSSDLASLQWPQLPGTGAEADAVEKTFKGLKVYRGDAATEGAVKTLKSPPILHLATHGFFLPDEELEPATPGGGGGAVTSGAMPSAFENPLLRSGLALAGANKLASGDDDGLLTALEASSLDLLGTKLVVLSACETGVGKVTNGDGVYGLRRSFILAGAESLVMSLWEVDDYATKELMTGFYKQLAAGTPRSEALRAVQLELLAKPKYAHPFYWAAFVPAGATSSLK